MACGKEEERMVANRNEKDGCTRRIVKGLMNAGNSCFFNSVMQNLLAVDGLRDHFMKSTEFPEGPITSALRKLYVETSSERSEQGNDFDHEFTLLNKGNGAVNPEVLFSAICEKVPQFRGFGQQDSHELLRYLLDSLNMEELPILSNSMPTDCGRPDEGNTDESLNQRHNATLVDRVFHGLLCSTISCSNCGYHSVMYEPFRDLSLPIPGKPEPMKVSLSQQKDPSSSKTQSKNVDDNPFHATGSADMVYPSLLGISRNVQPVENQCVENMIPESVSILPDGPESPLPAFKDSEILPLSYKQMAAMAGEDDNFLSATGFDDMFCEGLLDTSENVQGVENQHVEDTIANVQPIENQCVENMISESVSILPDGSESPLPALKDSEVLSLPYKEMASMAGEDDNFLSVTGFDDMFCEGLFDTSENVQGVENQHVEDTIANVQPVENQCVENMIPESVSILPDDSESPLPAIKDSEVLSLPYKEMASMAGEDDNFLTVTGFDDMFCEGLFDTSENVQGVQNQHVEDTIANVQPVENQCMENMIPVSVSILPDGSESPLSALMDSGVLPLPYKEMVSMADEDDNFLSATGVDDMFCEGHLDTSENVQGVENLHVEDTIAKSDFGLPGCLESPLPHKQMHYVAGAEFEVTNMCAELNTDDALDKQSDVSFSSITALGPSDDICNLSDEDESSVVQENKIELGESKSPLYGENDGNSLFMDMSVTTEMKQEETEAAVNPISVDHCLVEFTKPELLSGENGWKCPNCASYDNLEKLTAKKEQGMGINCRLNSGSVLNFSDSIMDQNQVEKSNLLKREKDTELEVSTSAKCFETSDTKTDESQLHSGSVTGIGAGLNDNKCQQTEVLYSLNDIDNDQPSNEKGHQLRRGFLGQDCVPVHDSSAQGIPCSHAEGHSNKNVLTIFGAEGSSVIDGINQVERPASTSSEEEGGRISTNLGEWDLESQKFRSSGEGHILKKRKSKTKEHEANSNNIIHEATKRYLISEAPPILTIHLKRFKHDIFGSLVKLTDHVVFQERLDLRPYLDPRCQDKDNCIYRLIGVVEHEGIMEFGHYVAYVRCDQVGSVFQWFHVSDSRVKEVPLREVLECEAYILFYEKCKV